MFALILIDHVIGCEYKWMAIGYNLASNNLQSIPTHKIHKYSDIEITISQYIQISKYEEAAKCIYGKFQAANMTLLLINDHEIDLQPNMTVTIAQHL